MQHLPKWQGQSPRLGGTCVCLLKSVITVVTSLSQTFIVVEFVVSCPCSIKCENVCIKMSKTSCLHFIKVVYFSQW